MRPHNWEMANRDLDLGHLHSSGTSTPSRMEVQRIWVGTGAEGSGTGRGGPPGNGRRGLSSRKARNGDAFMLCQECPSLT